MACSKLCRFWYVISIVSYFVISIISLQAATYGSDTAVSIVNPFNITGQDNVIKSFGCVKNGFKFADGTVTCSYQSMFPVEGPMTLSGGSLYLQSDLRLGNTATFADLGIIYGQNHMINLSESVDSFASRSQPTGRRVFNLIARVTAGRTIQSLDWSYDNKYLVTVTDRFPGGNEITVYYFNGTTLTSVASANFGSNCNSVRWRPGSYYFAVASNSSIRLYLFNSVTNAISLKNTRNPSGTYSTVTWQGRGNFLAAGGSTIRIYTFTAGTETLDSMVTPTNIATLNGSINIDTMRWAPAGNKDDLIVGTSGGSLHLYSYSITGSTLNHLKKYNVTDAVTSFDWARTSTYLAVGFQTGAVKTYQHTASTNIIAAKATLSGSAQARSLSWKPNATELVVGYYVSSAQEFRVFDFNTTTYALTARYGVDVTTEIHAVRFSNTDGTYIARSDNTTRFLSIYKETTSPFVFKDVKLFLNDDLTLGSPLTFEGSCLINARNNKITFTSDGVLNVAPGCILDIQQGHLDFQRPSAFAMQGRTSQLRLHDTKLDLSNDVVFGDGAFESYEDVTITGPHTFFYASAYTSTVRDHANLIIKNGAEFKIGKTRYQQFEPLEFESNAAQLSLDNATLHITNSGLMLKKGIINIYNKSVFNIDYTDTSLSKTTQALVFGDGINNANDVILNIQGNGTELEISNGGIILDPAITKTMVQFSGQSQLSLDSSASLYFKRPLVVENGWVRPTSNVSFSFAPGAYCTFDKTRFDYQDVASDYQLTGTVQALGRLLLDTGDSINVLNGTVYDKVTVSGAGNEITGVGNVAGQVVFSRPSAELTWNINSNVNEVALNGQHMTFAQDAGIANGYTFVGTGTVNLGSQVFAFNPQATDWPGNLYWDGNGSIISLRGDVNLEGVWTFSGIHTIDGNGYEIDLESTGTIIIERGSQVTFKNITLENVSRHNGIVCQDDAGQVRLQNVKVLQNGDYLFDKGGLFFADDVDWHIAGDSLDKIYTFSYDSTQTSTIYEAAALHLNQGIRLSIGRKDSAITTPSRQPLIFAENTSCLDLAGGTLHITSSGMIVTKGHIQASRQSNIETDNTKYEYALILGDGTADNDCKLEVIGGRKLVIRAGKVFYNNYSSADRLTFGSDASILRIESPYGLTAKRNLLLSHGTLSFPTSTDNLAELSGASLAEDAMIHWHDSVNSEHRVSASTINPLYFDNGGYVLSMQGSTSLPLTYRAGTGSLSGSGASASVVTLNNNTVSLNLGLNRGMAGNIALNGGSAILSSNMDFINDKNFTGSGVLNLNTYKLSLGSKDYSLTNTLLITAASGGGLALNSYLDLRGSWTVSGNCEINGNGNVLDLSRGKLTIPPHSTVYLTDMILKGLGTHKYNLLMADRTSQLKLARSYVELDNNFSMTSGGIVVDGPTTFGLKNYNWTLDNRASMTIDGTTLWIDTLDASAHGSVRFGSGPVSKYLSLVSSGTIKTAANADALTVDTSTLEDEIANNSNALLYCCRTTSNALLLGDRVNSSALLLGDRVNSNAITYLASTGGVLVTNNSNAIVLLNEEARTNSNAQLACCRTMSNALLFGNRITSNALLYANRVTSNAIAYLDATAGELSANNSNAIVKLNVNVRTDSNALLYCCRITSNALLFGDRVISNAVSARDTRVRTDSNAFLFLARNMSNALLYGDRISSNAMMNCCRITSNALLFGDRVNSNALLFGDRIISNAWIGWTLNNSNYLIDLVKQNSALLEELNKATSDAIIYFSRITSNALLFADRVTSNSLLFGDRVISNALLFGDRVNSNALLYGDRITSNTNLYLFRINSNAIVYGFTTNSTYITHLETAIKDNSNAIVWLDEQLDTIDHGPANIVITTTSHYLTYDIFLSADHLMTITSNTVFDGKGHTIHCAEDVPGIIQVADNCQVTLKNIVLDPYDDSVFMLGNNARVVFGNETHLILAEQQHTLMPWICQGEVEMFGDKTKVTINPLDDIVVLPHSTLSLHEIELCGLKQNNMRCSGATSAIVLSDSILHIDNDFSFTSGSLTCDQEVMLTGSMMFDYASDGTLTVSSDARLRMEGVWFNYQPPVTNKGLFALNDRSSILSLEGCSLVTTTTGMQLTKGTLMVDHKNVLFNDGTSISEGFIFGNGDVDDNLDIQMKPGGSLDLASGCLDYQNIDVNPA